MTQKKCFSTVYQFWKQKYINQNGSGLVVKIVKCSHKVPGSIPSKTFFSEKLIRPAKKGGIRVRSDCLTFIYIKMGHLNYLYVGQRLLLHTI